MGLTCVTARIYRPPNISFQRNATGRPPSTMTISPNLIVPVQRSPSLHCNLASSTGRLQWANYLPDELLLEVLSYIPEGPQSQTTLAQFCLVSRQWYDLGIERLYRAPYLVGKTYDLFVRTVCPSVLAHIKKSELAGLGSMSVTNFSGLPTNPSCSPNPRPLSYSPPRQQGHHCTPAEPHQAVPPDLHRATSLVRHQLLGLAVQMQ